jgi:hypothetical protein
MPIYQSRKPDLTLILDFGGSLTRGNLSRQRGSTQVAVDGT